jgi:hypothetical protein
VVSGACLLGKSKYMATDARPQTPIAPEVREGARRPPADPPLYSEASSAEDAQGPGRKRGDRKGKAKAEAEELIAEEIAESQDSAT